MVRVGRSLGRSPNRASERAKRRYRRSAVSARELSLMVRMMKQPDLYADPRNEGLFGREAILTRRLLSAGFVLRLDEGGFALTPQGRLVAVMYVLNSETLTTQRHRRRGSAR